MYNKNRELWWQKKKSIPLPLSPVVFLFRFFFYYSLFFCNALWIINELEYFCWLYAYPACIFPLFFFRRRNKENIIWDCIEVIMFKILFLHYCVYTPSVPQSRQSVSRGYTYACVTFFFYCLSKLKKRKMLLPIYNINIPWCWKLKLCV